MSIVLTAKFYLYLFLFSFGLCSLFLIYFTFFLKSFEKTKKLALTNLPSSVPLGCFLVSLFSIVAFYAYFYIPQQVEDDTFKIHSTKSVAPIKVRSFYDETKYKNVLEKETGKKHNQDIIGERWEYVFNQIYRMELEKKFGQNIDDLEDFETRDFVVFVAENDEDDKHNEKNEESDKIEELIEGENQKDKKEQEEFVDAVERKLVLKDKFSTKENERYILTVIETEENGLQINSISIDEDGGKYKPSSSNSKSKKQEAKEISDKVPTEKEIKEPEDDDVEQKETMSDGSKFEINEKNLDYRKQESEDKQKEFTKAKKED